MGIYSRSVTNSTDANYNSIVLMTSQDYTIRLSQSYSSSSKSGTWAWQTDATGGSSSISFSTNSSQWGGGVANFNARLFINHPFPGTMSGGNDYFFARYWFTSASGQSITRALALSVYGIPINANSTNKSALYDTGNGNLDGNNQYYPGLGFLQNTSFYSTNILPASFDVVTDIANTNTLGIGGALQYLPFQLFL